MAFSIAIFRTIFLFSQWYDHPETFNLHCEKSSIFTEIVKTPQFHIPGLLKVLGSFLSTVLPKYLQLRR